MTARRISTRISELLLCFALIPMVTTPVFAADPDTSKPTGKPQAAAAAKAAGITLEETAVLTDAPFVPPPITRTEPALVKVHLEILEVPLRLADGVEYTYWTFGGAVPGKFIRVREGDVVEFHLSNHQKNKLPHNIDLHAVTGPGGGAASTFTAPGRSSQFTFTALNPGLYVYHCATAPVGMHVANGMYGLIFVQPKEGMEPVDAEFYVMQSEVYTRGRYGEEGLQPFDLQKAIDEEPPYVVFNGAVGSLVGEQAMKVKTDQKVRIFVGNGGPNLISSFHVIGEIFDKVYLEGGTGSYQTNVQTTVVPAGGSAIVEFKTEVPGTLVLVDHSLFRSFNKGALGMMKVEGPENKLIYSGKEVDESYLGAQSPEGSAARRRVASLRAEVKKTIAETPKIAELNKEIQMERGKRVYLQNCSVCHQSNGEGLDPVFPPLAKSDYLNADEARAIRIVRKGLTGPIVVNGKKYDGVMPALGLSEEQTADVITYIRNAWGNTGDVTTIDEVRATEDEEH